jgi:hypothetical protein
LLHGPDFNIQIGKPLSSFALQPFIEGLESANRRKVDEQLTQDLMKELHLKGYCASMQSESWRVINRPLCPIKVQIEIRETADKTIDVIPLSAYTETLETRFPLADLKLPHVSSLPFRNHDDIADIVKVIEACFPANV